MQISIYTDGACDIHAGNRPGGWAAILRATDENGDLIRERVVSGGAEGTTNNRMELTAVIEGLKALKSTESVTVYSDSRYVIDIGRGTKKSVKNKALWQEYDKIAKTHLISWQYVAGHSGDALNERCDRLAVAEKNKRAVPKEANEVETKTVANATFRIYLSTQYQGKVKASAWAALVVEGDRIREFSGRLKNTTEIEATLIGAIAALNSVPAAEDAALFTAQEYLAKGMNQWLPGWQARGWKRATVSR